jgi:hypothetical protein
LPRGATPMSGRQRRTAQLATPGRCRDPSRQEMVALARRKASSTHSSANPP